MQLTIALVFVLGMQIGALIAVVVVYRGLTSGKRQVRGFTLVPDPPKEPR